LTKRKKIKYFIVLKLIGLEAIKSQKQIKEIYQEQDKNKDTLYNQNYFQ